MEEFNNKFEPDEEIHRIQADIDSLLNDSNNYFNKTSDNNDLEQDSESVTTPLETDTAEIPQPSYRAAAPAYKDIDVFYRETIKKKSVNPTFVIICAISLIVCCLLGFCLGIGFPAIKEYLNKDKPVASINNNSEVSEENGNSENRKSENGNSENNFAFEKNPSKQDVVLDEKAFSDHLVNLVNMVEPSVVCITSLTGQNDSFMQMPFGTPTESGSGIIFHEDSEKVYIATNAHVISNAQEVQISISEKEAVSARLVGSDSEADLAVITVLKSDLAKVNINNVTVAKFGDSDKLQVGELVLAIGNALGEGNTATMGIISAKEKQITVHDKPLTVVQTNAAINPGNSGGPLINMNGEVIGINTAKISTAYDVEGMGYSITSNKAKPVIEDFMNRSNRPFLGVSGIDVTEEIAKMYSLPTIGVFVNSVIEGSAAEKAGIVRGDIIVAFNGKTILSMQDLTDEIKKCNIEDQVEIKIIRNGKDTISLKATLEKFNDTNF